MSWDVIFDESHPFYLRPTLMLLLRPTTSSNSSAFFQVQIFPNLLKLVPNFPSAKAKRHLVSRENFVKVFEFGKFDFV
jgi:hypothetical protein